MILSFHPLFEADKNITCAGRQPGSTDLKAIKAADAVILPQGCYQSLFEMAHANCPHVFPDYKIRFKYPGKLGQIKFFRKFNIAHPASEIFFNLASFYPNFRKPFSADNLTYPFVFKFDWGGEGETVFLMNSEEEFNKILQKTAEFEKSGQYGFLLQEYISSSNRTLRVVIIGQRLISYWRIQNPENGGGFYTNLGKGAVIDAESDSGLQHKAVALVKQICNKTGINLAGFDLIFSSDIDKPEPMLLEINYFFGRKGLGGSEAYYKILLGEIQAWLAGLNLGE
ncbi:MAG: ATP-grasp domain-containing protein [Desulfobacterales bacterium]|jgi:ribosomal protein S6--L-glutamate ligase